MNIGENEINKIIDMSNEIEHYAQSNPIKEFEKQMVNCIKKHASQLEKMYSNFTAPPHKKTPTFTTTPKPIVSPLKHALNSIIISLSVLERSSNLSLQQLIQSNDVIMNGKISCHQMNIGENEINKILDMSKEIEHYAQSNPIEGFDTQMVNCIKKNASQLETMYSNLTALPQRSNYSAASNPTLFGQNQYQGINNNQRPINNNSNHQFGPR